MVRDIKDTDKYSEEYESFYDPVLDIWLEDKCDDPKCKFCKDRPNKPSDIRY